MEEASEWLEKFPDMMLAIVTGSISGLVVVDVDTEEGVTYIDNHYPELAASNPPTVFTPRGGVHMYFKHTDSDITNRARLVEGTDIRGEGGYVIAPPSENASGGKYEFARTFTDGIPVLPYRFLTLFRDNQVSFVQHVAGGKLLTEGRRDDDLFHVANCLMKGGMKNDEVIELMEILAKGCNPPFPEEEARVKAMSALRRAKIRSQDLEQEIRDFVEGTHGIFSTKDIVSHLNLSKRDEKKNLSKILNMLEDEELIERAGVKEGMYRIPDKSMEIIDLTDTSGQDLDIILPLGLHNLVNVMPKNIIVVAGEPDAGKTAFLLNIVKDNMDKDEILYFSSEMGRMEFRKRLLRFNIPIEQWSFTAIERSSDFADVIHPDAINIVDFLEVTDEFFKVGQYIKDIWEKLNSGIAIIALQKNRGRDEGLGGFRSLEKPRLYVSLGGGVAKIVKAKNWVDPMLNPNGLTRQYYITNGWEFHTRTEWFRPDPAPIPNAK